MRPFPRTILYAVAGVLVIALISSALTMIIMNRTSGDRVVMSAEEYSVQPDSGVGRCAGQH